ncbi:hypothetical protein Tco_0608980 [Tanacetum coccineum]
MADNRTMAELLQAPTEGYEDAIVIPDINANFELKHDLINLVLNKQFFGHDKEDPHAHIRYFNKITSTMRFPDVPSISIKLMLFPFSLEGSSRIWLEKEPPRSILIWDDLVSKFINQFCYHDSSFLTQDPEAWCLMRDCVDENCDVEEDEESVRGAYGLHLEVSFGQTGRANGGGVDFGPSDNEGSDLLREGHCIESISSVSGIVKGGLRTMDESLRGVDWKWVEGSWGGERMIRERCGRRMERAGSGVWEGDCRIFFLASVDFPCLVGRLKLVRFPGGRAVLRVVCVSGTSGRHSPFCRLMWSPCSDYGSPLLPLLGLSGMVMDRE